MTSSPLLSSALLHLVILSTIWCCTGKNSGCTGLPQAPLHEPAQAPLAPEISQAFANASRVQDMMRKTRSYYEVAGMAVRKMLEGKLGSGGRQRFEGKTARIVAIYGDGAAAEFSISADNQELRNLLQDDAAWSRVPSPRQCLLQYKQVAFLVSLDNGNIQVGLSPQ